MSIWEGLIDVINTAVEINDDHIHHVSFVYPELAACVTLTADAGAWGAYPTPTEIIPASTITDDFDLHFLSISSISANGKYVVALYQGAALSETLIGKYTISKSAVFTAEGPRIISTPVIAANTRISAAISSSNAAADTLDIKVEGHVY